MENVMSSNKNINLNKPINKKYKIQINDEGDYDICFNFLSMYEGERTARCFGETSLDALSNLTDHDKENTSKESVANKIWDFFENNYPSSIQNYAVEYYPLFRDERYEEWANVIINFFDNPEIAGKEYIQPLEYDHYFLKTTCSERKIKFKGRNAYETLRSFAIANRKFSKDLECHRYGLSKFLENFKRHCNQYFGVHDWCDEEFFNSMLGVGIFESEKIR